MTGDQPLLLPSGRADSSGMGYSWVAPSTSNYDRRADVQQRLNQQRQNLDTTTENELKYARYGNRTQADIEAERIQRKLDKAKARPSVEAKRNAKIQARDEEALANQIANGRVDARVNRENLEGEIADIRNTHNMGEEMQIGRRIAATERIYKRNGNMNMRDLKDMGGISSKELSGMMDEIGFTAEQKAAFNRMHSSYSYAGEVASQTQGYKRYEAIKSQLGGVANMSNEQRAANMDNTVALNKERQALEEKIRGVTNPEIRAREISRAKEAGQAYADARHGFLNSMGGEGEKITGLMDRVAASKAANAAKNASIEAGEAMKGNLKKFGKIGVAALVGVGLVQALSSSRGQQENNQLYNPGGGM